MPNNIALILKIIFKNYIFGAFRISFVLFPEKIFVFTALLTAVKSRST